MFRLSLLHFISITGLTNAQQMDAPTYILNKIDNVYYDLTNGLNPNLNDIKQIVCLTNIETEKVDGSYIGIIYYPTKIETLIWRDWVIKNKNHITYYPKGEEYLCEVFDESFPVVQVKLENGDIRNSICIDEKEMLEMEKYIKR